MPLIQTVRMCVIVSTVAGAFDTSYENRPTTIDDNTETPSSSSRSTGRFRRLEGLLNTDGSVQRREANQVDASQRLTLLRGSYDKHVIGKTCKFEVQEVRVVEGRCMELLGGRGVCQSDLYMSPIAPECSMIEK